jgi:hypothetical protein
VDKIPYSPIYILPSLNSHKPIPKRRLDEILKNVKEGSVFYLSLDKSLFRNLPEMTSVRFFSREERNVVRNISLGDEKLKIVHSVFHNVEPIDAEILACDENDNPVYFKKAYGKGFIYFSIIPIEGYLSSQSGVFENSECADYSLWYKQFAKTIESEKTAISSSSYVCLTEHIKEDGDIYIYAINYSTKEETATITFKDGFVSECIFGNYIKNNTLTLGPCEAGVFLLKKKGD